MIRVVTLLCKLKNLEFSDKELFSLFQNKKQIPKAKCSFCKSDSNYSRHSSYTRMMITIVNGKRAEIMVSIPRVRCHCGRTHGLLPDILIPYSSYSLKFVITVIKNYLNRSCTIRELCDFWQISVSTLYSWIHLFRNHYNLWVGAINQVSSLSDDVISAVCDVTSFPSEFFKTFRFSFMQFTSTTSHLQL